MLHVLVYYVCAALVIASLSLSRCKLFPWMLGVGNSLSDAFK